MSRHCGWLLLIAVVLAASLAAFVGATPAFADRGVGSGFASPEAVAVDSSGDVFVADTNDNQVVEEIPDGAGGYTATPTIIGGLNSPDGVAVDSSGNVFVSSGNSVVEETPNGSGGFDGTTIDSGLAAPRGLAVDSSGDVFVADYGDGVVEEVPQGDGSYVRSVVDPSIGYPRGVAIDGSGDLFVTDGDNSRVVEDTPDGSGGYTASFVDTGLSDPSGLAVDAYGDVFVADGGDNRVVEDRPNGSGGYTQKTIGSGFTTPQGVAVDAAGDVFVADTSQSQIVELPAPANTSVPTISGGTSVGQVLKVARYGTWRIPTGESPLTYSYQWQRCDSSGNNCANIARATGSQYRLTHADVGHAVTVVVAATDSEGVSGHAAATPAGPANGYIPVDTGLSGPETVAVDSSGDVFVADTGNNRVVEEVPNGTGGYTQHVVDDYLDAPAGVAVDSSGDVFVTEPNLGELVEETPVGLGAYTPSVVDSSLEDPQALAVNTSGDVFVDQNVPFFFPVSVVVEETPDGSGGWNAPSTVLGPLYLAYADGLAVDGAGDLIAQDFFGTVGEYVPNGSGGYDTGPSIGAFADSAGLAVDGFGDVFVADTGDNSVVQEAALGGGSFTPSTVQGGLDAPHGVAVDSAGDVFVADTGDNQVIELPAPVDTSAPSISGTAQDGQTLRRTSAGSWKALDSLTYSYRWERCDGAGANCQYIAGATGSSYRLTHLDVGQKVGLVVTATDQEGVSGHAAALTSGVVAAPPAPSNTGVPAISGAPSLGQYLKVSRGTWTSVDPLTYSYQWRDCDSSGNNCSNIATHATGSSYRVAHGDLGGDLTVVVTATDAEGQATSVTATAVGPAVTYTVVDSGLADPHGAAVDSSGDVFVAEPSANEVVEETPNGSGGYTESDVGSGLDTPEAVAVDGSGDVFIADSGNDRVVEDAPDGSGGWTQSLVDSGFSPQGVAVDGAGNVFVTQPYLDRVVEDTPNGGGYDETVIDSGDANFPIGIAVDGSDDVFLGEAGNSTVVEQTPDGSGGWNAPTVVDDNSDLDNERALAVDSFGDVFIADPFNDSVFEDTPNGSGGYTQQTLDSSDFDQPWGIAVDSAGDVFVSDDGNNRLVELPAPVNTVAPAISGQALTGVTLRPLGRWRGVDTLTYTYEWQHCNSSGAGCQDIPGATASTYALTDADLGYRIRLLVTVADQEGISVHADEGTTPVVAKSVTVGSSLDAHGVAVDSSGDVFVADTAGNEVVEETPDGHGGYSQSVVDSGLDQPSAVAVDSSGDVYVADTGDNQVVEEVNGGGGWTQTVVDGDLNAPQGVAVDSDGNVFVADTGNGRVVEDTPNGSGGWDQSVLDPSVSSDTRGIAVDPAGDVFIADPLGGEVTEETPNGDGTYTPSTIDPSAGVYGIAVDGYGDLFLAESHVGAVVLKTPDGNGGYTDTQIDDSGLTDPYAIAVDSAGDVFVADPTAGTVEDLPAPVNTSRATITGTPYLGTPVLHASVGHWTGLDSLSYAYQWQLCDGSGNNCQDVPGATGASFKLTQPGLTDAGDDVRVLVTATDQEGVPAHATPLSGPVTAYRVVDSNLSNPYGIALDGSGDVFVGDESDGRVVEDTPNGSGGFTQSVIPTGVAFPDGVAVDSAGDLFIADPDNNRVLEEEPNGSGGYNESVVDNNLGDPLAVAVDGAGDVFVTDSYANDVVEEIPNGSGGYLHPSTVVASGLLYPGGVAVDASGDVFIADTGSDQLLEVVPDGSGEYTQPPLVVDGNLSAPRGVAIDSSGDVFVADADNNRIVEETPTGSGGYAPSSIEADFSAPAGVAVDSAGDLFVADTDNDRVDELPAPVNTSPPTISGTAQDGQTLVRTSIGSWQAIDPLTYSYQWRRCDGSGDNCSNIPNATHSGYRLTPADVGHEIALVVSAADQEGVTTRATVLSGVVQDPAPPQSSSAPTFSGTAQIGQTLGLTSRGSWTSVDPLTYSYQWQRCSESGASCQSIAGATRETYRLVGADVGHEVTLDVTATDAEGQGTSAAASPSIPVTSDVIVDSGISSPQGVAVDSSGDVFVAGQGNGVLLEETPNGSGGYTQTVVDNSFGGAYLTGTAVDSSGDVFTADAFAGRLFEDAPNGSGGYTQSTLATDLSFPDGVAVDSSGDVFVADTFHRRVIEETLSGGVYNENFVVGGTFLPEGIAVDSAGDLFVTTSQNTLLEETPDGSGGYTGSVIDSNLDSPNGVAVDASGDVFVADAGNNRVVEEVPNGGGGYSAEVLETGLNDPQGVAVDSAGNVFITDSGNSRVLEFQALTNTAPPTLSGVAAIGHRLSVSRGSWSGLEALTYSYQWQRCDGSGGNCQDIAGATGSSYLPVAGDVGHELDVVVHASDGATRSAQATPASPSAPVTDDTIVGYGLDDPRGLAVDSSGDVFVADPTANLVLEETPDGSGGYTQSVVDNSLDGPVGVAVDASGDLFVAVQDSGDVVEETPNGSGGYTASEVVGGLLFPDGVAVDPSGDLFVSDSGTGDVTEYTPDAGSYDPSPANPIATGLDHPAGIALDAGGNLFVGSGNGPDLTELQPQGDGSYASTVVDSTSFAIPSQVAVDAAGDLFVADDGDNSVAEDEPTGGGGYSPSSFDHNSFNFPAGIAINSAGDVFVSDSGNGRVVEYQALTNTARPTISGIPALGQTLKATPGSWAGHEALTYSYQWQYCDNTGNGCQNIQGATGSTYRIAHQYLGDDITVVVGASDGAGRSGTTTPPSPVGPVTAEIVVDSALESPTQLALDPAGDLFVVNWSAGNVLKETPGAGGYTESVVDSGFVSPSGVAVDGSGDVFVADSGEVLEETPDGGGGYTASVVDSGLDPQALAMDSSGDLFVTTSDGDLFEETPDGAGGYTRSPSPVLSGIASDGVAVDPFGDVFVSDTFGDIWKETPDGHGGYTRSIVDSGHYASSLATDASGDVFFTELVPGRLFEATPDGSGAYVTSLVASGLQLPQGVAVDASGHVFVTDSDTRVLELTRPANTSLPSVTGTPQDGQTLRASVGHWTGIDALGYAYQWQRCDGSGESCQPIAGATSSSFKLTRTDIGDDIAVAVTATDQENVSNVATSAVGPITNPQAPSNTSLPTISGPTTVGKVLKVFSRGSWTSPDPLTYTYQWQDCDGSGCTNILNATGSSYRLTHGDVGQQVTVVVTATDTEAQSAAATASPVGPVTTYLVVDTGLNRPQGVAVDGSGDVFVVDENNRVVEETPNGSGGYTPHVVDSGLPAVQGIAVDSSGDLFISATLTYDTGELLEDVPNGSGGYNRTVIDSGFSRPLQVAVDGSGDVFVADEDYGNVVEEVPNGSGGFTRQVAISAIGVPQGLAVDGSGDLFVAEENNQVVEVAPGGHQTVVTTAVDAPAGVAVDASGDVFVADTLDSRVVEDMPNDSGGYTQTTLSSGAQYPQSIAVDGSGDVFVADSGHNRLTELRLPAATTPPSISGSPAVGQVLTASVGHWTGVDLLTYAYQWQDCNGSGGSCQNISGATSGSYRVKYGDLGSIVRLVLTVTDQEGQSARASTTAGPVTPYVSIGSGLSGPADAAVDSSGVVFIADAFNNRVVEDVPNGTGGYTQRTVGSGLLRPSAVAVDASGDVFVVSPYAGDLVEEAPNGGGGYTQSVVDSTLSSPVGVAVDSSGDVFVADDANRAVYEYTPAGGGGYTQTVVKSNVSALGVAVDASGDLFIADGGALLEETPAGGGGYTETTIDDNVDYGVAVDSFGDLFVLDIVDDGAVRQAVEETPNGDGTYTQTVLAAGGPYPAGISVDASGNVFVADYDDNLVEELTVPVNTALPSISGTTQVGKVLTRSAGSWTSPDSLTYATQWQRCSASGNDCLNIPGATGGAYKLTSADNGHEITVVVTVTDQEGVSRRATATAVGPATNPPPPTNSSPPTFSGQASVGQTLTRTSLGQWTSLTSLTYSDQWQRCDSSGGNCVNISGATGVTYKLTHADLGSRVTLQVTATDVAGQHAGAAAVPGAPVLAYGTVDDNNLFLPPAVAVDSSGNVFVAVDGSNPRIVEDSPNGSGGYTQSLVDDSPDISDPQGLAVDSSGDVFIADSGNNEVLEDKPSGGGYSQSVVQDSLNFPEAVAVDSSGDVFTADSHDDQVIENTPNGDGGYNSARAVYSDPDRPSGVAVDGAGDLFVLNPDLGQIVEVKPNGSGGYTSAEPVDSTLTGGGGGLSVDRFGDLFFTEPFASGTGKVIEDTPTGTGYTEHVLDTDVHYPNDATTDAAGDVFVADTNNFRVVELPAPQNTVAPTISGASALGQTLKVASVGVWGGIDSLTYSYQWQRCDGSGQNCANIGGATGSNYRVASADVGHEVTVVVTAADQEGVSGHAVATPVGPVNTYVTVDSGLTGPEAVAVDASGDVFVAEPGANAVVEETPNGRGGYNRTSLGSGLDSPGAVAVDGAGDVFIADTSNDRVLEETPNGSGGYTQSTIAEPTLPLGLAVDSADDVFVSLPYSDQIVEETPDGAGGYAQTTVAGDDEGFPTGLALDVSGDLFVAEAGTSSVVEYAPGGSGGWSPTTIDSSGDLYQLRGVAVDSAGDIFVADTFADSVIEDTPNGAGGYTQHVLGLGSGLLPWGVATDAAGDLFVADTNHNRVIELPAVANTALPTITGTTAAGQVLTRSGGHWTSPDSLTYATQWELCNSSGNGCQNIAGATGATYTLTSADNGLRLTVAVTVTDQEGMSRRVTAIPVGPVGS